MPQHHAEHQPHPGAHQSGTGVPAAGGAGGLAALMSELLADSAVQERVRQDPTLRELWSDAEVRQHVTGMTTGMEKLMELVHLLLEDPAVSTRIEDDPALRELWGDAGVRDHIRRSTGH